MELRRLSLQEWGEALPEDGFEPFHLPEALEVLNRHATGELRLYGGFEGGRPIGLLPVVVHDRLFGTVAVSPPPGLGVPRLGPVLTPAAPGQCDHERVNREFTSRVLDEIDADSPRTLFRMTCNSVYRDPRPYAESAFDVSTSFTYVLDLERVSPDELMDSFSKSLRREIREGTDLDAEVTVEGVDGARDVFRKTQERYDEQDRTFSLSWEYVRDLITALEDRCRVYVARTPGGKFLGGITVLYSNGAAYFWQGGVRAEYEGVSVNGLLHWRVIEDLVDDPPVPSVDTYDLMGANTERLCKYKSKFGAELVPYFVVESDGKAIDVAKTAYRVMSQ